MLKYAFNLALTKIFGTKAERDQKKYWPRVLAVNALADEIKALSDEELRAKTDELRGRYLERKGEALARILPEIDLDALTNSGHQEMLKKFQADYETHGAEAVKEVQADLDLRKLKGIDSVKLEGLEDRFHADKIAALEELMPEAYAVVREGAERVIGERHYDVQIYGGIVLFEGKIAEMATGEGKTLVSTLPTYLTALAGEGTHVVTVNDYLARRDAEWMGQIYEFFGMTVGAIQHDMDYDSRRRAYHCDITYGTNNEFGFDYLRDNMARHIEECVQRRLFYCIVDEVDNILIDEARTPLIISGPSEESTDKYYSINRIIASLKADEDFEVNEKDRNAHLTESGAEKAQGLLGVENMFDEQNLDLVHYINTALKAHHLFKRDEEYVIQDGEVVIVDEFTGRLMTGRRYSDGLHQAIEAKEGVKIRQEQQTLATITFQNFFRLYKKLAGMTGTADTEAIEFQQIYDLEVVVIPTNRPIARADHSDVIYRSEKEKFDAVVDEIADCNERGQPVLVGTVDIEKSERLAKLLKRKKIPHKVLNAKFHKEEAEIVAQAGRKGGVTIATNMAGRGTDIKLGGAPEFLARATLRKDGKLDEVTDEEWHKAVEVARQTTEADKPIVKEAGGLHVVGTERHESRRIDNQLRGRSGRQGDPGSSRFFLSLEDDLLRIFGSERLKDWAERLGMQEGEAIEARIVSRSIEKAQKRVEEHHFDIRKNVLKYDDVMEKQRTEVYEMRRDLLEGDNPRAELFRMVDNVVQDMIDVHAPPKSIPDEWDMEGLQAALRTSLGINEPLDLDGLDTPDKLGDAIREQAKEIYEQRCERLEEYDFEGFQRHVLLHVIDQRWKEHLLSMDHIRDAIGLRGYGGKEPIQEYQREGFEAFEEMFANIENEVVRIVYNVEFRSDAKDVQARRREQTARRRQKPLVYGPPKRQRPEQQGGEQNVSTRRTGKKVGRNDPCPCGSGKKYKKCCGAGE